MISKDKLYIHMPFPKLLQNLEEFCSLGANCQIYIDADAIDSHSKSELDLLNNTFNKYGLCKSTHGSFYDLNTGSFDKGIRQMSLERLKQCADISVLLNAKRMVIHSSFDPIYYRRYRQQWLENSTQTLKDLIDYASKKEITILVENSIDNSCWAVLELIKGVKGLKACFDIAHYNAFSPLGWRQELERYPPDSIDEVHLSDNMGDKDAHLPLGEGNIDFKSFFHTLDNKHISPYVVLEPHDREGLLKGLEYVKFLQ